MTFKEKDIVLIVDGPNGVPDSDWYVGCLGVVRNVLPTYIVVETASPDEDEGWQREWWAYGEESLEHIGARI